MFDSMFGSDFVINELNDKIDDLESKVKKLNYLLDTISANTVCIGTNLCHVDGNCIHCTARIRW